MFHVNIIMLPVDINKSHVNKHVILFHVGIKFILHIGGRSICHLSSVFTARYNKILVLQG